MTSIREFLSIAFREKRLLMWAVLIPPVLALLLAFIMTPVYEATASLLIKTGREYSARDEEQNGGSGAPTSTKQEAINSEIEIMTNRAAIEEVIHRVGLTTIDPSKVGIPLSDKVMDKAVGSFLNSLTVKPVKLTNVIDVAYDNHSAKVAVEVVDALIDIYKARHAAAFAELHSQVLKDQIDRDNAELQTLLVEYEKIKLANHISSLQEQQDTLITAQGGAKKDREDAINRRDELRTRLAYLTTERRKVPSLDSELQTQADGSVTATQASLVSLRQTESDLLSRFGPDQPQVVAIRQQISSLEHDLENQKTVGATRTFANPLAAQIDTEMVMDQAELAPLDAKIAMLEETYNRDGEQLQQLEQANVDLVSLDAKIKAHTDNLTLTRDKYEQARVQDDLDSQKVVSVSVIQPAIAESKPVAPKKLIFAAVGLLLGLVAAGTTLIILVVTRNTLLSAEGVERILELPVLTSVPRLTAGGARLAGGR